jgi:hypothetical protein
VCPRMLWTFKLADGTLTIPVTFDVGSSCAVSTYALVPETIDFSGMLGCGHLGHRLTTGFRQTAQALD